MLTKKEAKPILHRQKCKNCDFYTVYQAIPFGEKAVDTCTHCQYAVEIPWDHEIKAAFKNKEKFLKNLEELYPELADLKNPGRSHLSGLNGFVFNELYTLGVAMFLRLIIEDVEKARERGLEAVNEIECNEAYCATSQGYPVFQLPNEQLLDCGIFRQLRDECGARIETNNIVKLCLGLGIPRDEPGVTVID